MGIARKPENERQRIAALREYGILDTAADPAYTAFADLASEICEAPMAAISFVDSERQWVKASVGLGGLDEIPRAYSLCAHAILDDRMLEVNDATLDARFADNPFVTADPNLRFYAGVPLIDSGGRALGTICTMDHRPRVLSDKQRESMQRLGSSLVALIEARKGTKAKTLEHLALVSGALEYSSEPTMIAEIRDGERVPVVAYVNRAFTLLFGYGLPELVGRPPRILYGPDTDPAAFARLRRAARAGEAATETIFLYTDTRKPLLVEFRDRPIDAEHRIVNLRDLTPFHEAQRVLMESNQRLDSLISHNGEAVLTVDLDGKCTSVNGETVKRFGYSRAELLGNGLATLIQPGEYADCKSFPPELDAGNTIEYDAVYRHRDGRALDISCKAIPIVVDGRRVGAYLVAKDVTAARRAAKLVEEQAKRAHALYVISSAKQTDDGHQIDEALQLVLATLGMNEAYIGELEGDGLRIKNSVGQSTASAGDLVPLNATYLKKTIAANDVVTFDDLADPRNHEEGVPVYPSLHGYITAPLSIDGRMWGVIGFISSKVTAFNEYDRDFIRLVAALVSSAVERRIQSEQLARLAFYDGLTGLPNRTKFLADLDAEIGRSKRHGRAFALHYIDLDGFKNVNDRAGHAMGDLALQEAARRLKSVARAYDVPARLGGDEFVLLQSEVRETGHTEAVGDRLVRVLSEPYVLAGETFEMTASVGIAIFPDDGNDARNLLQGADMALYRAKAKGKNRVEMSLARVIADGMTRVAGV